MAQISIRALILILIVLCSIMPARADYEANHADMDKGSMEAHLQDLAGSYRGSPLSQRQSNSGDNNGERVCGPTVAYQVQPDVTSTPTTDEAQRVWASGKLALVDQLAQQLKDEEAAVSDESAAVASVKTCIESAAAAGLEARQQAKIINLLSRNSKDLIEHIDRVEQVSQEELGTTEDRLSQFEEKAKNLLNRISNVRLELAGMQVCGTELQLNRLRRCEQLHHQVVPVAAKHQSYEKLMEDFPSIIRNSRFPHNITSKQVAPVVKKQRTTLNMANDDVAPVAREGPWSLTMDKRDHMCENGGSKPASSEAQAVWVAGKRALIEQLNEQLKDDEASIVDESAAVASVRKCVESAVAAGLEARQQAKIINLLQQNSNELIEHIDRVENVANDELVSQEERLSTFIQKLQDIRNRIAQVKQQLGSIQDCGGMRRMNLLRRVTDHQTEDMPAVQKRHSTLTDDACGNGIRSAETRRNPEECAQSGC